MSAAAFLYIVAITVYCLACWFSDSSWGIWLGFASGYLACLALDMKGRTS